MKITNYTKMPEYTSWRGMRKRCKDPNNASYKYYKDISICKRWDKFENFLEDMGTKPSPLHSIDRIDNNLGYYKENCKWSTQKEQIRNRDCAINITYNGVTKNIEEWAKEICINVNTLKTRYHREWTVEKMLTTKTLNK